MTVNNFPVTVYRSDELAIHTNPKQMEATLGTVYLTRHELLAMLAMLDDTASTTTHSGDHHAGNTDS